MLIPLGGGGLTAGIAIAVKSRKPEVEVIGVQVESCAPFPQSLDAEVPVPVEHKKTIADGIAVKRPGEVTLPLLKQWLDGVAVVSDDQVADAMGALMADGKLVVEGAGAVGVAALLSGVESVAAKGTTAVILSGGNLDPAMLEAVARRAVGGAGHAVVLSTRISDRPGSLAALLEVVAGTGASVVEVRHVREGIELHIAETGVELHPRDPRPRPHRVDRRRPCREGLPGQQALGAGVEPPACGFARLDAERGARDRLQHLLLVVDGAAAVGGHASEGIVRGHRQRVDVVVEIASPK